MQPGLFRRSVIVGFFCILQGLVPAAAAEGPDALFTRARAAEQEGRRAEAIDLCHQALAASPGYHDVRVYLGRLHARDRQYDAARAELETVLKERPDHLDALVAAADVELWSGNRHAALARSEAGLALHPGSTELLTRKARALRDLRFEREALDAAREAQRLNPDDREIRRLVGQLEPLALRNKISVDYQQEWFEGGRDPWREGSFEYSRRFRFGSVIGRVSQAHRFQLTDALYEIDAYPHLGPDTYLYLNAGTSTSSDLYPLYRWGAEIHQELPAAWEISAGVRRLVFESEPDDEEVTLWTGSLGRYYGDNFTWGRVWHSNDDGETSWSGTLHWRHYYGHSETYTTVIAGGGSNAEEDFITQSQDRLDSRVARFEAQKWLGRGWVIKGEAGWRHQEYQVGPAEEWIDSWLLKAGFERFF